MSMIVIQQEKGQKFINRGEKIQEVSIILKGKVAMRTKNDEFIMEKGTSGQRAGCTRRRDGKSH